VLAGLWLTARRIRASERRAESLEDQVRVTEQGQVTERFTRAIEQLNDDDIYIRLGAIYSLGRTAKIKSRMLCKRVPRGSSDYAA